MRMIKPLKRLTKDESAQRDSGRFRTQYVEINLYFYMFLLLVGTITYYSFSVAVVHTGLRHIHLNKEMLETIFKPHSFDVYEDLRTTK